MQIPKKGKLFILSAPSGAGKTSLVKEVLHRIGNSHSISKVITYTTRHPRKNEKHTQDYHFVSIDKFNEYEKNGFFIETNEYNNQKYGTPYSIIDGLDEGKSYLLVIDINGAKNAGKVIEDAVTVWISAPNIETLLKRIKKRGSETQHQLEKRLEIAEFEIKEEHKHRFFKYHLVNDIFDEAVMELVSIVNDELK
jgi:guanylate kinase